MFFNYCSMGDNLAYSLSVKLLYISIAIELVLSFDTQDGCHVADYGVNFRGAQGL